MSSPDNQNEPTDEPATDRPEKKGFVGRWIRLEVLTTLLVVVLLVGAYSYFFLDKHLEWGIEYVAGRSYGAEVNVDGFRTGWLSPGVHLDQIRLTDPDNPDRNLLELGPAGVEVSLDALLRAKVVVTSSRLEGIRKDTPRESPGWVQEEGGDLRWVYDQLRGFLRSQWDQQTQGTVLADVGNLLDGGSAEDLVQQQVDDLGVTKRLDEARSQLDGLDRDADALMDRLPDREEFRRLEQRIESLGDSSTNLMEKIQTLRELESTYEEYEGTVEAVREDLGDSVSQLRRPLQNLDQELNQDLNQLRDRVSLPSLDLEDPSGDLFRQFVQQRGGYLADLLGYYEQYVQSPGESSEQSGPAPDPKTEADTEATKTGEGPPESSGRDHQFPVDWSYPDYWLQEFVLAAEGNHERGIQATGRVRNLSYGGARPEGLAELQLDVRQPTEALDRAYVDVRESQPSEPGDLEFEVNLEGWSTERWDLADGSSLRLALAPSRLTLQAEGHLGRQGTEINLVGVLPGPEFMVESSRSVVQQALSRALNDLEDLRIRAQGSGTINDLSWQVDSNVGGVLQSALRGVLEDQADEIVQQMVQGYRDRIQNRRQELLNQLDGREQKILNRIQERTGGLGSLEEKLNKLLDEATSGDDVEEGLRDLFSGLPGRPRPLS